MPKRSSANLDQQLFKLIPALYPIAIAILKRCGLRGPEFFTLSYIRHHGKQLQGEYMMLTSDLSDLLTTLFYESEGGSSGFVTKLAERGLLRRAGITAVERLQLFGSEHGSKAVIVLRPEGEEMLERTNTEVRKVLTELFPGQYQQQLFKVLALLATRISVPDIAQS